MAIATVQAQPTLTGLSPTANAQAAPRTGPVTATFSQALASESATALKVYSTQRGGLRTQGSTPAVLSGNTLRFTPTAYPFLPGETVSCIVTTAAASSSGRLATGRVIQFTTAVGGTGRGTFQLGTEVSVGAFPFSVAVGDVDGDGDLDLLTANQGSSGVSVRLNGGDATGSNTGLFSNGSEVAVNNSPYSLAIGDVDGDGDLDLLTANYGGNGRVSVRLNGGDNSGSNTGLFSQGSEVVVDGNPYSVTLGDVDGDGDLDLLSANNAFEGKVSVRLNGGDNSGSNTGLFSQGSTVPVGPNPYSIAVGDVDGDGDIDVLTTHYSNGQVSVRLNGGDNTGSNTGLFSQGSTVLLNDGPYGLALGDVDGDGDLDLVTANSSGNRVSVRLNGGDNSGSNTGLFSQGSEIRVPGGPQNVALGDVDGDGDLDLVTANLLNNTASVRLNGGDDSGSNTGLFSQGSTLPVGTRPFSVALGDVDGDGDLDLVTANTGTVSVRLNQPGPPLVTQNAPPVASSASFVVVPTLGTGVPPSYAYTGPALGVGARVSIYTLTGRRVWEATLGNATSGALPVAGLASGWYLVHLQTANGRFITRFFQP